MSEEIENTEAELDAVPMLVGDETKPEFEGLLEPEEELVEEKKNVAKVGVGSKEELLVTTARDTVPKQFMNDGVVDVDLLAESYTNLQKKMRSNEQEKGISGVPDMIENYAVDDFAHLPEDVFTELASQALDVGMNSDQLNMIAGLINDAYASDMETDSNSMKEVWGKDYSANLASANKAWKHLSGTLDLEAADVKNNPTALKILANIGSQLGEDVSPAKSGGKNTGNIEEQIDKLMNEPDYFESAALQKKVQKLMGQL